MPITMLLEQNCKLYPEDIALVELNPAITDDRRMTWREYDLVESAPTGPYRREITWRVFNEKANRFANLLLERGIKKGDKVGILLMNCLEWLPIYFGTLKTGALAVPLNFRYTAEEIEYCVNLAECDVLVFGQEFIGRVESIADRISKNRLLFFYGDSIVPFAEDYTKLTANCSSRDPRILITDEDYAAIYFSSGTTGFPKAILHNHESLMHSAKVEQKHHGQTKNDVFLCIPPLYHTGAKMHWFGSLISGSKAVLLKGTKPEDVLAAVSNERCSIVWLLVPWAQDILDALDSGRLKLEDYNLKKWRLMHIGAQPVPPSMIKHWKEYFPNHLYDTNYGLSESIGPGCVHLGTENIHKVGAIGVPGYGWQCKIVDEDHNEITEAEKVISGGENIYPVQIEDFLHTFEPIKDVAVIGLADKRLGEKTAAIIEIKEGYTCTKDDVEEYCLKLPRYKRPREIIFAHVPRNATGKIEKPRLREEYGAANLVAAENQIES